MQTLNAPAIDGHADLFERTLSGPATAAASIAAIRNEAVRLSRMNDTNRKTLVVVVCHCADGRSVIIVKDNARQPESGLHGLFPGGPSISDRHGEPILTAIPLQTFSTAVALVVSAQAKYARVVLHRFKAVKEQVDAAYSYKRLPAVDVSVDFKQDVEDIIAASGLDTEAAATVVTDDEIFPVYLDMTEQGACEAMEHFPDPHLVGERFIIEARPDGLVDVRRHRFGFDLISDDDLRAMIDYLKSTDASSPKKEEPYNARTPHTPQALNAAVHADCALVDRFLKIASVHQEKTALVFEGTRISYRALVRQAEAVENRIRSFGVENKHVAISMERTPAFIAAILGTLKAGCAYIPVDPATPAERQAAILKDSKAVLLITSVDPASDSCSDDGAAFIRIQTIDANIAVEAQANSNDIAYVIYTSGSTGTPKGVAVPHSNVIALVDACTPIFDLRSSDVWSLFHSMAFDFSVWEMWGALLTGATLVIVPYWTSRDPAQFADLVLDEGITVLSQTPSAFYQFSEQVITSRAEPNVRLVIFGGEKLVKGKLLAWFDRFPETRCRLVNMYGITETTVHVTYETVTRNQALKDVSSVGVALPGWRLGICDKSGVPLPNGLVGEICVFGAGVARGYLNRPELTASRFDTDPKSGLKRYRSGDRGRLDRNSLLYHYGRIDNQIKLRGFRIELGDIVAQIRSLYHVSDAVVLLDEGDGQPGSAVLRAFVVGKNVRVADVRARLNARLPEYMRPASVSIVAGIPMSNNGKSDGKRLLAEYRPERDVMPDDTRPTAASGNDVGLADQYRAVWSECFGAAVTEDANFFDLGGNSLIAIKINQRLKALNLPEISLKDIYIHQNIASIANANAAH
ncbi:non-ribosomal peptide synthetase [Robbsia andropogonis]|uniref:non-ribosomal peptide synthetase n=1 Tax=Robbsia andropogonis TaxID=28092 RepID=UPI0020A1D5E5|nr:non-ribosomal peptide synthetase [Robbsia andropogonis]MCP1121465.1 non-ribosomal peptide synthetase [Robbsia andropogonis]